VRSRHYTRVVDGEDVPDRRGDLDRTARQRAFLTALLNEVGGVRAPWTLHSVASSLTSAVMIDDSLTMREAISFGRRMGRLTSEPQELPVTDARSPGGAQVLFLGEGAQEVLAAFK
jgi:anionic cell wall polymer biosynthesis LytR-Cps2A-Psr (LCP) family protein